jgi:hypothetical protein
VYNTIKKLIKEEWMTPKLSQIPKDGKVDFRGFYGKYKITLTTKEGRAHIFTIHLSKNANNQYQFKI